MRGCSRGTRARFIVVVSLCAVGALAWVTCALLQSPQLNVQSWRHLDSNPLGDSPSVDDPYWREWLQESGVRVSAIVFYGRKRYVRVLDGYLKRNLVSAGGLLEEGWSDPGAGYSGHYSTLLPNRFYVKLDDDIMYVKDDAIDAMLHQKLKNEFWMVSANVINHAGEFSVATAPAGPYVSY
ncbi:TPA: hypothetical protein ACH3X1_014265 [Trebouxia sp. C0004]